MMAKPGLQNWRVHLMIFILPPPVLCLMISMVTDIQIFLLAQEPFRGNMARVPQSYLLQNDKAGKFIDVTSSYAKELVNVGFVTQALWF